MAVPHYEATSFLRHAEDLTSHRVAHLSPEHAHMFSSTWPAGSQGGQFGGLLILGSGLNERTRKQPAGENKGDGRETRRTSKRIQRTA